MTKQEAGFYCCIYGALFFVVISVWMSILIGSHTREEQFDHWFAFFEAEDAGFNVLQEKLESLKQLDGEFSFRDTSALADKEKMTRVKTVVEGTVAAYDEFFDTMKNAVDRIAGGVEKGTPGIQKAYDALAEDFSQLKGIEDGYGVAMADYIDFVIAHEGKFEAGPEGVRFESQDLADKYAVLEKKALEESISLSRDRDSVRDKLGADFSVFMDELVKRR